IFFFSSRRRHTRFSRDWSSDVCSSDLHVGNQPDVRAVLCLLHGRGFTAAGCVSHFMMFSGEKLNYPVEQAHLMIVIHSLGGGGRSEERRVGKEGRVRSADSG